MDLERYATRGICPRHGLDVDFGGPGSPTYVPVEKLVHSSRALENPNSDDAPKECYQLRWSADLEMFVDHGCRNDCQELVSS